MEPRVVYMRMKLLPVVALAAASLAVSVSGCSSDPSFEDSLRDAASDSSFTLPSTTADGASWSQLAVLCPYGAVPSSASDSIREAAADVDTDADDGHQWLVFDTDGGAETVKISRESWDFCNTDNEASVYTPDQKWTASEDGGVTVVRPAD